MPVEIVLTRAVTQLPTLTFPGWDDFGQIARTLNQLEHGMFRHASVMADQMRRDDRFSGVIRKRVDGLDQVPLLVKPADDSPKAAAIAEDLGGDDDLPGKWGKRWPAEVLSDLRFWAIMMGICPGELVWKTDDEETPPAGAAPGMKYKSGKRLRWSSRLIVWNPQWLRWDWSLFRYRLMTGEGEITLPDVSADVHSDGKWILFAPFGYTEAWKKGLVRPSARLITRRQWTDRDWSRHNEKNGLAVDKAIVPAEASKEAKDTFFLAVADRNGETAVMCEQSADPAVGKFDLELVESTAKTWDTFQASKQDVNTDIAVLFLGQNTTTELKEGKGSLGVQGHSDVERGILRKDAAMADCIYEQGLYWDALHNYGDGELAPRPMWQVDPPEDQVQKAQTLLAIGQGLVAFKTADAPIDDRGILEQANLPVITPEEQAARQAVKAEQQAALARASAPVAGAGGDGDDEPDGGEDKDGPPPAKGKPSSAKMGTIRASSSAAISALSKLADRAIMARAAAAKTKSPKELRYAQNLEKAALQLGVSSLAIDLASVKHEIEHASSFADLEQRLLRAYKGMDPRALASAVAKTRIMANLGGRLSVHKQVGSNGS